MIEGKRVLALVPARRGSKGLPLKNIRPLHGKPLLAWPIAAAQASRYIDDIVISTDDPEFAEIAVRYGARAPFLRPAHLASDEAPSIDFILDALDTLNAQGAAFDILVLLEPTSPLTEAHDIDQALERLIEAGDDADAIVGVSELTTTHPAYAVGRTAAGHIHPLGAPNFDQVPVRRQELPPAFMLDGSLYISKVGALQAQRSFYHPRTLGFVTERHKAFEVDDLVDFWCIEAVMARRDEIAAARDPAPQSE